MPADDPGALHLYPFEFYDLIRRRWVRARYRATVEQLAARGDPVRIVGQPEVRTVSGAGGAGHLARGPAEGSE
jgi:hypothetical protein